MIWYIIIAFIVGVITGIVLMALCAINKTLIRDYPETDNNISKERR